MAERADDAQTTSALNPEQSVQIRVLGGVSAIRAGIELDLGGRRQRAVLAVLLAARGKAVSATRLIDLVWDEEPPANPTAALQSYVSHLRRRLEPDGSARGRAGILRSGPAGYAVHLATEAVDAWRFEAIVNSVVGNTVADVNALREALALWRGRAFADYPGEAWAEAEATRLDELHALAEDRLFAARLDLERPGLLVPDLEMAVATEPLREERWRLLALALYRDNRQGDALAAIRRAKDTLVDQLGIDPGPALRELEGGILEQSPDLLPKPEPQQQQPTPTPRRVPPRPPDDLVERDGELARIEAVLADAQQAHGAVLLVEGPAGIGKTRLLGEAAKIAEANGAVVLIARGSQLEQQFGFGAVRQLFEPLLREHPDAGLLSGAAEAARAVFDGAPSAAGSGDGVFAALHGLYWLAADISTRRPLVLAVDDLQWCDTASLRFFAYLARRLDGMAVVLATTLRTGEEYAEATLIAEIQHDMATTVVRPGPLTLSGAADLVRARLGADADQRFIAACHRTTAGNPLLLRQVLRALEADRIKPDASHADVVTAIGSRAIASLVLMRLSRLSEDATSTARAVAVLGDGAELPTVAALCGLSEERAANAIAELVRTEMLRDEYPLSFVHPLIRDAVYRDVPAGVRQLQHERAARVLDAANAPLENIAAHLLQVPARGDQWVVDVLCRAAGVAADRGAPEGAASYLNRALLEPPPEQQRTLMLLQLGGVESLRNGFEAARHLREAYERMPPGPERAEVAQVLTQVLIFAGDRGDAARFAHAAAQLVDEALVDERQGLVGLERMAGYMHGLDPALWDSSVAELSGDGPGSRRLAASLSWEVAIRSSGRERAVELASFALRDGLLQQHDTGLLWVVAAVVLDMADEDLGTFWQDCWASALAQGSLFSILAVHLWWGNQSWRAGDLREAEALLGVANEQSLEWGSDVGVPYCDAYTIHTMIARGHLERARLYVDDTRSRNRIGDGARLVAQAETRLLLAERRYADALELTDLLADSMSYVTNPIHRHWHRHRSGALHGLGRVDEALEQAHESVRLARQWGAPRQIGIELGHLGYVQGAAGGDTLREAIEVLTPTKGRVELARAQYHLAGLLGGSTEARALLHQAFDIADGCAADGLRREVQARLEQHGETVRTRAARPHLTSLERRIARMAVDGADEREIAQALFLTSHAVQVAKAEIRARIGSDRDEDLEAALVS